MAYVKGRDPNSGERIWTHVMRPRPPGANAYTAAQGLRDRMVRLRKRAFRDGVCVGWIIGVVTVGALAAFGGIGLFLLVFFGVCVGIPAWLMWPKNYEPERKAMEAIEREINQAMQFKYPPNTEGKN